MKRKILSTLLCLCMVATMLAAFTITASAVWFSDERVTYTIEYKANAADESSVSGLPANQSQKNDVSTITFPKDGQNVTISNPRSVGGFYLWSGNDGYSYRTTWEPNYVGTNAQIGYYNEMGMQVATYYAASWTTTSVTLIVSSDVPTRTGYTFAGWYTAASGGSYVSAGTTYTNQSSTLYAHWNANNYSLSVNSSNTSYGTVSGSGTYAYGTSQTITASPKTGYKFVQWNDGNTTNPRTVTISGNATYTANFAPISYTISTAVNNPKYGSVTGGGAGDYNTTKTLTAIPNAGYKFTAWGDKVTTNPRTVTITGSVTYKANFGPETYAVALNANGGTCDTLTSYTYGTAVTLPIPEKANYTFGGWYDNAAFNGSAITEISTTDMGAKEYFAKWTAGLSDSNFTTTSDSGFYAETADSETKSGAVAFTSFFSEFVKYESDIDTFGLYIYNSLNEANNASLTSANAAALTAASGYFFGTVEEITADNFANSIVAKPYVVIGGQTFYGNAISRSVLTDGAAKWLGAITAE